MIRPARLAALLARFRRRPTRAELIAEAALWKFRCERKDQECAEAFARAKDAEKRLRKLTEPDTVDGCHKVRFHRRAEAEWFVDAVAASYQEDPADYDVYQCRTCPHSPATTARYWHIGHVSQEVKARNTQAHRARQAASRRAGRTLGQRIDPRTLAQLRSIGDRSCPDAKS